MSSVFAEGQAGSHSDEYFGGDSDSDIRIWGFISPKGNETQESTIGPLSTWRLSFQLLMLW
jgi:hypothetical protein